MDKSTVKHAQSVSMSTVEIDNKTTMSSGSQSPKTPSRNPALGLDPSQRKIGQEDHTPLKYSQSSQTRTESPLKEDATANSKAESNQGHDFESKDGQNTEFKSSASTDVELGGEGKDESQALTTNQTYRNPPIQAPASDPDLLGNPSRQSIEKGPSLEIAEFDWKDFHLRWHTELSAIVEEENHLAVEFDKFSEAFALWARSAAERDIDRATKRLKTRERYVELAEDSLTAKKVHYVQVVDAFKKALSLLGR